MTLEREALRALGVERLVFAVHDRALPARSDDDLGCGTPGGAGASALVEHLAALGFDGLQLGPPGVVDPGNLSPYDGTAFLRSPLNLSFGALLGDGRLGALVDARELAAEARPRRVVNRCEYDRAFPSSARLWSALHARWDALAARSAPLAAALDAEVDHFDEVVSRWAGARGEGRRARREQWLLRGQHAALRQRARSLGVRLYADLQAGLSIADRRVLAPVFLPGYHMGAPPSRTNPAGQPWGYPVPDPDAWGTDQAPGPAQALWSARFDEAFDQYDGLRIDHPHALVCPWLYRADDPDPYAAVRAGARLHSVGSAPAHARLSRFDLVAAGDLASERDPWDDDYVRALEPAAVDGYARVVDLLVASAKERGLGREAIVCEVLSTMPAPLGAVLARHGLGRFRVTSKANVDDPRDVYLHDQARPEDWIMVGTHDTPPIWRAAELWSEERAEARAAYAAARLFPRDGARREAARRTLAGRRPLLAAAELALLFTSRAANVMIFASDWLGEREIYNHPGEIRPDNWTLSVPEDFAAVHAARAARGEALDLRWALALALDARPERDAHRPLVGALRAGALYRGPAL